MIIGECICEITLSITDKLNRTNKMFLTINKPRWFCRRNIKHKCKGILLSLLVNSYNLKL